VYHGGKHIGTIKETYDQDIGLVATLRPYPFSNRCLDINVLAQKLHSSEIAFGSFTVIDSSYTSRQRMRLFGLRTGKKPPPSEYNGPVANFKYVVVDQGIYSVQAAVINREPRIRDGICGTPS